MNSQIEIPKSESETIELKKSLGETKEIIETIVGFANRKGGEIWVGIAPNGIVEGITIGANTIERLSDQIKGNTNPPLYPEIHEHKIEDKVVLRIRVYEGPDKPYLAYGRGYIRAGKTDQVIGRDEFEKILIERIRGRTQFDTEVCQRFPLTEISESQVRWYLGRLRHSGRYEYVNEEMPTYEALEKLGVLFDARRDQNGNIVSANVTNAGVLQFARNPQQYFLQAEMRCARFRGDKPIDFVDMKVLQGTLTQLAYRAMKFVKNNIRYSSALNGLTRRERWEYPLRAVQEAVVNALVHRDYYSPANVQLSIFDDRMEIWNPGGLPGALTIEGLKRTHQSIPRNQLIANLFFHIKYVERWGTGTITIIEEMKKHGLPEPVFEQRDGSFLVTLRKSEEN